MWVLSTDGGCRPNPGAGSFGVVVERDGRTVCRFRKDIGQSTNNVAEWRGVLAALDYALANVTTGDVEIRSDSQLVVMQLTGCWRVNQWHLTPLAAKGQALLRTLQERTRVTVRWVPRERNGHADLVAAGRLGRRMP